MNVEEKRSGPGRPREFDVDRVIADAMEVFQTHGYAGTSLIDLLEGTGLTRGSLYKAFEDKRTLFLAALAHYTSRNTEALAQCLKADSALTGIRAALLLVAADSSLASGERGCLLVSSATEMASKDESVKAIVRGTFDRIQSLFQEAIGRGQRTGEISMSHSPADLARFILCTIEGLGVVGKSRRSRADMTRIVEVAMSALA